MADINIKKFILPACVILLVGILFGIYTAPQKKSVEIQKETIKEIIKEEQNLGEAIYLRNTYFNGQVATTSGGFIVADAATSTFDFDTSAADSISVDFAVRSSTTGLTLFWIKEFSLDGIDYFPETGMTINSVNSVSHNTEHVVNDWTYATTTNTIGGTEVGSSTGEFWGLPLSVTLSSAVSGLTVRKDISIEPIASHKTRIRFWTSGADASVWIKATVRERR